MKTNIIWAQVRALNDPDHNNFIHTIHNYYT